MVELKETQWSQERIQEFEFQKLYRPGSACFRMAKYLEEHPFCTKHEITVASGLKYTRNGLPELTKFRDQLLKMRKDVGRARQIMKDTSINAGQTLAVSAFKAIAGYFSTNPEGEVKTSYLDNPLAFCITVGDKDFRKLYWREDQVGGCFDCEADIRGRWGKRKFPVIAIRWRSDEENERTLRHELCHAYIYAVVSSLNKTGKSNLWGYLNPSWEDTRTAAKALDSKPITVRSLISGSFNTLVNSSEYATVFNFMIGRIKDEGLVRIMRGESFYAIFDFGSVYDYTRHLRISSGLNRYFLMESARLATSDHLNLAKDIVNTYKSFNLSERANVIPWILMRIPIQNWERVLRQAGVMDEVSRLKTIGTYLGSLSRNRVVHNLTFGHQSLSEALGEAVSYIRQNPDRLAISKLQRCVEAMQQTRF